MFSRSVVSTKDPRTDRYEIAEWIPDHFAPGQMGVKFPDGTIYNPRYYLLKIRRS